MPSFLFSDFLSKDFLMRISNNGINVLKRLEGCVKQNGRHIMYNDASGRPVVKKSRLPIGATIGYGHLIKQGEDFSNGITEEQATELLLQDIYVAEKAVCNNIRVPLSQNQYDAMVIFVYNIGVANFAKSTVVKYINNPNFRSNIYPDLESAWLSWNKSRGQKISGLANRRKQEWILFNS